MSLTGFQRRRRELAKKKALEEQKKQEQMKKLSIDDLTKDEIIAKLKEKGIDHNPRDKKDELIELLKRS
ncbi:MAG: hypothetical protein WBL14_05285 [Caldicoprobacterales bacterium]